MMKTQMNRKLHGSVLLTVVFVMSILIVLLFGTMTLATATNKRAHSNYTSSQTGVTARMAVDSALRSLDGPMSQHEDYKKAIGSLSETNSDPLYAKVSYNGGGDNKNYGSMGRISDIEITWAGKKSYYDTLEKAWYERDVLKFTADAELGGVTKSSTAYVMKHLQGETVGNPCSGAGFVSAASAQLKCKSSIFGGAYINIPSWDNTITGDKERDYYTYGSSNELKGMNFKEKFPLNQSDMVIEADLYACTDVTAEQLGAFIFPNKGKGITVWGDFNITKADFDAQFVSEFTSEDDDTWSFKDVPYLFVNGTLTNKKWTIGREDLPFNVFCGSYDSRGSNPHGIYADVYCMDGRKTSYFVGGGGSLLYDWAGSVVNKVDQIPKEVQGNIYSKGNVVLENVIINGDVRVDGNLTINGNATILGDIVANMVIGGENKNLTRDTTKGLYYNYTSGIDLGDASADEGYFTRDSFVHTDSISKNDEDAFKNGDIIKKVNWVDYYKFTIKEQIPGAGKLAGATYEPIEWGQYTGEGRTIYYTFKSDTRPPVGATNEELKEYLNLPHITENEISGTRRVFDPETGNTEEIEGDDWGYFWSDGTPYSWKSRAKKDGTDSGVQTEDDYTWYKNGGDENPVSGPTTISSAHLPKSAYPDKVYPEYAEKLVLLGLQQINDKNGDPISIKDTKVVNTVKDVLDIVQLYKYDSYENIPAIKELYTNLMADPNKLVVKQWSDIGNKYIKDDSTFTSTVTINDTSTISEAYSGAILTRSCIIDGATFDQRESEGFKKVGGNETYLVIDPSSAPNKEILVVFQNTTNFESSTRILVNDTGGGKVYFYIDNGATLNSKGGPIFTAKYLNVLENSAYSALAINTKSSICDTTKPENYDLSTLGAPNLNIYGTTGSHFNIENCEYLTANVLSSEMIVDIKATNSSLTLPTHIYYNDQDLRSEIGNGKPNKQFILGSLTAKEITNQCDYMITYIGDDGGDGGNYGGEDNDFWYRVLYYTEY